MKDRRKKSWESEKGLSYTVFLGHFLLPILVFSLFLSILLVSLQTCSMKYLMGDFFPAYSWVQQIGEKDFPYNDGIPLYFAKMEDQRGGSVNL